MGQVAMRGFAVVDEVAAQAVVSAAEEVDRALAMTAPPSVALT